MSSADVTVHWQRDTGLQIPGNGDSETPLGSGEAKPFAAGDMGRLERDGRRRSGVPDNQKSQ
jgi:hypothetical protein